MRPSLRSVSIAPRDASATALLRLLDRWRTQLECRHFCPWRIDHDLKAVADCTYALGPPARWRERDLRQHFAHCQRKTRGLEAATLGEIAVRRFWAFYTAPAEAELLTEMLAAWWDRLVGSGCKPDTAETYRDKVLHFIDVAGALWRGSRRTGDRFSAARIEADAARETLRADQGDVKRFLDFLLDPAEEDWVGRV
ncbi:MAG: hypothetical protein ACXVAO_15800, partial [Vulcanimicrobiaceae bacterium]